MPSRQTPLTDDERSRAAAAAVEQVRAAVERPAGLRFAAERSED
jgi:hypothetical protein